MTANSNLPITILISIITAIKILEELNISQRKLCRDLNFSTDAFTRWKNGQLPFLSSIISIAKYLNVEIEELIGRK